MTSSENQSVSQHALADVSATGDWLRLTVMLLLLVVARLAAPMAHSPKPVTNVPEKPLVHNIGYFLTGGKH